MNRRKLIGTAPIPGQDDTLQLYDCGDKFVIRFADGRGGELMTSRMHQSEDRLGELPCRRLAGKPGVRVLIGGLGMGFTVAAVLRQLGVDAEVTVVELIPEVVQWNRGPLGSAAGEPLRDPRVKVVEGDVAELIAATPTGFDALLLDVDNGPDGLTRPENSRLYGDAGIRRCLRALRPGGVLAVWSAGPDQTFRRRLEKLARSVEEHQVFAHGNRGTRHIIWLAER